MKTKEKFWFCISFAKSLHQNEYVKIHGYLIHRFFFTQNTLCVCVSREREKERERERMTTITSSSLILTVLVCWGCYNKIPQTG